MVRSTYFRSSARVTLAAGCHSEPSEEFLQLDEDASLSLVPPPVLARPFASPSVTEQVLCDCLFSLPASLATPHIYYTTEYYEKQVVVPILAPREEPRFLPETGVPIAVALTDNQPVRYCSGGW